MHRRLYPSSSILPLALTLVVWLEHWNLNVCPLMCLKGSDQSMEDYLRHIKTVTDSLATI